ncbi:HpcH/HpaI aldolase/citrate lyase family protein [Umezawaea endophytica]|uniref:Aldolase/citrate lyase family protein n=1 Tax=Umezawaea endophytica TaxID=1654476 RepID=A0A9X2VVT5_9PSEU|nr:aldolase/citrate lyase family protein [Umezawaea endophytica]MCS7483741.1 aldolase/citrate lyase family protein [Umezawaea endophytica]
MLMRRPRRIRAAWEAGGVAYGVAVQLPSPDVVEVVGQAGFDYTWIDAEHGSLSLAEIRELIRGADAVGIDAIVRVADHDPSFIQRVLDLGAAGIMAAHVCTVEQTTALVAAARYAPAGRRGACPAVRSVGHVTTDWASDRRQADEDVLVFGLVEDPEGVENVEAIASRPGLDGLVFGPFDLSMAWGLDGDVAQAEIHEAHDRVVRACRDGGIEYVVANAAWEPEDVVSRTVTLAGDRGVLFDGLRALLAARR